MAKRPIVKHSTLGRPIKKVTDVDVLVVNTTDSTTPSKQMTANAPLGTIQELTSKTIEESGSVILTQIKPDSGLTGKGTKNDPMDGEASFFTKNHMESSMVGVSQVGNVRFPYLPIQGAGLSLMGSGNTTINRDPWIFELSPERFCWYYPVTNGRDIGYTFGDSVTGQTDNRYTPRVKFGENFMDGYEIRILFNLCGELGMGFAQPIDVQTTEASRGFFVLINTHGDYNPNTHDIYKIPDIDLFKYMINWDDKRMFELEDIMAKRGHALLDMLSRVGLTAVKYKSGYMIFWVSNEDMEDETMETFTSNGYANRIGIRTQYFVPNGNTLVNKTTSNEYSGWSVKNIGGGVTTGSNLANPSFQMIHVESVSGASKTKHSSACLSASDDVLKTLSYANRTERGFITMKAYPTTKANTYRLEIATYISVLTTLSQGTAGLRLYEEYEINPSAKTINYTLTGKRPEIKNEGNGPKLPSLKTWEYPLKYRGKYGFYTGGGGFIYMWNPAPDGSHLKNYSSTVFPTGSLPVGSRDLLHGSTPDLKTSGDLMVLSENMGVPLYDPSGRPPNDRYYLSLRNNQLGAMREVDYLDSDKRVTRPGYSDTNIFRGPNWLPNFKNEVYGSISNSWKDSAGKQVVESMLIRYPFNQPLKDMYNTPDTILLPTARVKANLSLESWKTLTINIVSLKDYLKDRTDNIYKDELFTLSVAPYYEGGDTKRPYVAFRLNGPRVASDKTMFGFAPATVTGNTWKIDPISGQRKIPIDQEYSGNPATHFRIMSGLTMAAAVGNWTLIANQRSAILAKDGNIIDVRLLRSNVGIRYFIDKNVGISSAYVTRDEVTSYYAEVVPTINTLDPDQFQHVQKDKYFLFSSGNASKTNVMITEDIPLYLAGKSLRIPKQTVDIAAAIDLGFGGNALKKLHMYLVVVGNSTEFEYSWEARPERFDSTLIAVIDILNKEISKIIAPSYNRIGIFRISPTSGPSSIPVSAGHPMVENFTIWE